MGFELIHALALIFPQTKTAVTSYCPSKKVGTCKSHESPLKGFDPKPSIPFNRREHTSLRLKLLYISPKMIRPSKMATALPSYALTNTSLSFSGHSTSMPLVTILNTTQPTPPTPQWTPNAIIALSTLLLMLILAPMGWFLKRYLERRGMYHDSRNVRLSRRETDDDRGTWSERRKSWRRKCNIDRRRVRAEDGTEVE
jgi:hypothetical protein